jgi:hypothetical protein
LTKVKVITAVSTAIVSEVPVACLRIWTWKAGILGRTMAGP